MKKTSFFLGALVLANSLYAGVCSDSFKYDFTFFGSPNKEYVVTKNTFTKFNVNFPEEKLLNATLEIDALSLDTSADMSNMGKEWPKAMAKTRNNNTINQFFKKFEKDPAKVSAKITEVGDSEIKVAFTMNGVTKEIPLSYKVENGLIKASGKLEILDFNTQKAWEAFNRICEKAFHHGKSWSEININFEVSDSCK
ncbi:hypothetical protein F1B92_03440 [Campylobacter sp. FMV-PI01]|uniref:Lipid/polyisoprenoid-binding YceI-like domain-containing protein n=1 Tax=Campylobacter portucalensis TaxID=2608384 RepID=A0A6L5WGT8_9BACT|nr:YceI family protein [Campylobacter portucalensis]MSN96254.1 hypothetical protein [Campylobacter portucalensis]